MAAIPASDRSKGLSTPAMVALALGVLIIGAVLVWQAVTAHGSPAPTAGKQSAPMATLDIAVLVFREGLECILVLSAITAGLMGATQSYRRPIAAGAGVGFVATLITWFVAVGIVNSLMGNISALSIQAWTGLLAIVVLLVVMNWFFHKVYWTGWISFQNRKKRSLLKEADRSGSARSRVLLGLGILGFVSLYREGFEVVLFLQSYRLQMGDGIVFYGAALGIILASMVAVLNFVGHHRLPYKRMLILTGAMLAGVLFVMIGEQVLEMQQAGWIPTTNIAWLQWVPDWAGTWLSIFPNWEAIGAQAVGLLLVLGCYYMARYQAVTLPKKRGIAPFSFRDAPATEDVSPAPFAMNNAGRS